MTTFKKMYLGILVSLIILISSVSAAYYFFGVKPLNTTGITQLNQNISRMKSALVNAQTANGQLTTQLTTTQTALTTANATILQLNSQNSVLENAISTRYNLIVNIATTLNIPNLDQYYMSAPTNNPFNDRPGQILDIDQITPVILNAIAALKNGAANSAWQNKYQDLQSQISAAFVAAGGQATTQPSISALVNQLMTSTINQVMNQMNAVGISASWLNDGPTYHVPANPNVIFKSKNILWGATTVNIPDAAGNLGPVAVPIIWSSGGAANDQFIWNGFGWVIYKSGQIYTDATDNNGHAIGLSFVNLADIATRIKLPDGSYGIVLWGSTAHVYAKAFIPDLNTLPSGAKNYKFSFDANNNFIATPYNPYNNPARYQFITPPNAKDVDSDTLNRNYFKYDFTAPTTNTASALANVNQTIYIPKTSLWQQITH